MPAGALDRAVVDAPDVPGWRHVQHGKVRELYIPQGCESLADADRVLVVATDRISAFDFVLSSPIPGKGVVLTQLSLWWFRQLSDEGLVATHVLDEPVPACVAGRAMVCRALDMIPVECVARGYLTGSGLVEYRDGGEVCGVSLPAGLVEASRLPEAVFTPAIKADLGDHDENVSIDVVAARHGWPLAGALRDATLRVYGAAADIARARGIIVADTKFEFGFARMEQGADAGAMGATSVEPSGVDLRMSDPVEMALVLGDEVLTPDSSRFWPASEWMEGQVTPSFDKQFARDWLKSEASGWDMASGEEPPALPADIVAATRQRYFDAFEILTGAALS
ncbi:MAG: phosphoribosylaminoimidazolesuccinocarboxamide synthase [Actinomycetaceae bacterium]|nr:phosphoribosylaminoimidazolesuccinocarboxamide synthase [Actinomycetaceae bacterium]